MVRRLVQEASNGQVTLIAPPYPKNAPPKKTLHPLTSKGSAFVLKLGLVFKTKILSAGFSVCIIHFSLFTIHHSLKRIFVMNDEAAYADE